MINFILNDQPILAKASPGTVLLDFIRDEANLKGTKEGCREGDCGACTVLVGELIAGKIRYYSANSCLLPLGKINGKHIVTIEGINRTELNPLQQAYVDENATQCGFCTPGFIMALTAYFLSSDNINFKDAITAVDGNICRCTGYASIQRAIKSVCLTLNKIELSEKISVLISNKIIPDYFKQIPQKLKKLNNQVTDHPPTTNRSITLVAGGTDLFVQQPHDLMAKDLRFLSREKSLKKIWKDDQYCYIGTGVNIEEIKNSELLKDQIPQIKNYFRLFASTPIRNQATLGGNLVNASPIGDATIFFLALDSKICISNDNGKREIQLNDFYRAYKKLKKKSDELVEYLKFPLVTSTYKFNYEKVSKRKYLDIASVNSAMLVSLENNIIKAAHLSAGGVSPVPLYLSETVNYLSGNELTHETILNACQIADKEISPINDVRGSEKYKRLLLRQLIFSHFITLFPEKINLESLI